MLPVEYIRNYVAGYEPSMVWKTGTPVAQWQESARLKLAELIGLDRMVLAERELRIEYDRSGEEYREIRFSFQSEPGYRVPCHLLIPNGSSLPRRTMICLQGHSTGMHISLGRTKYPGDDLGGDHDYAITAMKAGYAAVILEQRDFGECGGDEHGPHCYDESVTNLLVGRTTIGERVWDVMRLVDALTSDFSEYVKAGEIYIVGLSGGGTATIYSAASDTRLAGAMPAGSACTYRASIGAMTHCICNYVPNILRYFDMGELLSMIAPRPLLVVSGERDPIFPVEGVREVYADAKRVYEALGAADKCGIYIGDGEHRFFREVWPIFNRITGNASSK